jgi:hypothetical protein
MECQCSKIPRNVRIIKVGDSEVGIIDLEKILRRVYLLKIKNESVLKEEIFRCSEGAISFPNLQEIHEIIRKLRGES